MPLSITQVDGSAKADLDAFGQVLAEVRAFDVPRWRETTPRMLELMVTVPWPGLDLEHHLVRREGEPVGRVSLEIPTRENLDMIYADIWVVPSARRQGIGRELFGWLKDVAGTRGRKACWHHAVGATGHRRAEPRRGGLRRVARLHRGTGRCRAAPGAVHCGRSGARRHAAPGPGEIARLPARALDRAGLRRVPGRPRLSRSAPDARRAHGRSGDGGARARRRAHCASSAR